MEIRPARLEELERYVAIDQAAFVNDPTNQNDWVERDLKPNLADTRVLVDDDGEIVTILKLLYPRLWLGDRTVAVGGFEGVASPPENRRQGHIRHLFVATLQELHTKGYNVAILYPFFFPFYKKFGFEQASASKNVSVKLDQLQKFRPKTPGRWRQVGPERWADFSAIYEKTAAGHFGLLTRDQAWWQGRRFQENSHKRYNLYIWYDADNQPQAYVIYRLENQSGGGHGHGRKMELSRGWTNSAAYHEVLAFLTNHDSQAATANWYTGRDDEIMALVDDPRQVEETSEAGYMLRLLDVRKAFLERAWPTTAQGVFTLGVKDDLFEWNNLALRLELAEGELKIQVLEASAPVGLRCDIGRLAQLYAGYLSPITLHDLGLLEVTSPADLHAAQQLFSPAGQPASHMADFF